MGNPVFVIDRKCSRACMRVEPDQMGLSAPREDGASSKRCRSVDLSGQCRTAGLSVSGAEAQRGQVVSGSSSYQEGCAAR